MVVAPRLFLNFHVELFDEAHAHTPFHADSEAVVQMTAVEISDSDRKLIEELRSKIKYELELVPSYSDDLSLLRWLVGWDRKIGASFELNLKLNLDSLRALLDVWQFRCGFAKNQVLVACHPCTRIA